MNRKTHNRAHVRKPAQSRPNTRLTAVALALAVTFPVSAATLEWTGGTLDTFLATPDNWSTNAIPLTDDSLSFAERANDAYTLNNNLTTALHSLVFYGGSYTLKGGDLTLTPVNLSGWRDPNILSVYGGSHTIDASITLQPLVINRTVSQEVFNNFNINVRGGSVLNLNAPINVGSFTLIPGLPYTDNMSPSPATIQLSVYEGSTLNLKGAVNNAAGRLIINNWASSVTVWGVLNVSELHLLGKGNQTTLRDNGAVVWGGASNWINLGDDRRLALDNSDTALNDRLGGADISMEPTATLELTGNASVSVTEQAGRLSINGVGKVNSPESVIRVSANGQSTVLSFSGVSFGNDTARWGGRVDFQTDGSLGGNERILFSQAPASTDGLINSATVNGKEFATYDGALSGAIARGVVAATTRNTLTGSTSTDNVFMNGADETITGAITVNSLASHDTLLQGGQTLTVGSGQVLLNGTNNIAPSLDFGARQGLVNIRSGQTTLQGGLQGSNGALVSGTGNLTISGVSNLTGILQVDSPTLTLAADNVLQGTDIRLRSWTVSDPAKSTLDIGTTTQTFASLSGGGVAGTGTIIATGASGISTSGDIAARLQAANGTVSLSGGTLSGDISARNVALSGVGVTSGVSATDAITASSSTIRGNGVLNGPSVNIRNVALEYATNSGIPAVDRINDNAAVQLGIYYGSGYISGGYLNIAEQGAPDIQTIEKIGALTISGDSSLNLSGNVGLLADSLTVSPGARVNVQLGDSGTVKFVNSPVAVDGSVVEGVLVSRKVTTATVTNGVVPVWATYSASHGLQTEHGVGTLASAGTGVVRIVANQPVNSAISIGGVVFDTADQITGSDTLTTEKGMVFFQDNTVSIANVVIGSKSLLANAGSNTIASNISGANLEKLGHGSIVLSGTSTFNQGTLPQSSNNYVFGGGVSVREGALVVTGTLNASVDTAYGAELIIKGSGQVNGNIGSVTLEQASFTNKDAWHVGSVKVLAGSTFNNQSSADYIDVRGGSATNTGVVDRLHVTDGTAQNAGEVRALNVMGTTTPSVMTNSGKVQNMGTGGPSSIEVTGDAKLENTSRGSVSVAYVSNGGVISNAGKFELLAGGHYFGGGIYEQTAGATAIDGVFYGDMLLKGGTLNGWGVITGTVTASGSARILPGHSPGIMEIENLVLSSGSVLELDVSSTGQSDNLTISGLLDAQQGSRIKFNILDSTEASALDINNYVTLSSQPTVDWSNVSFLASTLAGDLYTLGVNADGTVASVTAVPEAETYALMLAGLGLIGARVRRQRKAVAA